MPDTTAKTTVLNKTIVKGVNDAVTAYLTATNPQWTSLDGKISALLANDFQGDAANGYKAFFEANVKPLLSETLPTLMKGISDAMDAQELQLLDTLDVNMGQDNQATV